MNIEKVKEIAYEYGFVFGKYTSQITIDDELLKELDNSNLLIVAYIESYYEGVKAGIADTHRDD